MAMLKAKRDAGEPLRDAEADAESRRAVCADNVDPTPIKPNVREKILRTANTYVNGDRNAQYGDPLQDFTRTATMWSAYLDHPVTATDVASLMCLLKLSRIRHQPEKADSWIDLAGYAACGAHCIEAEAGLVWPS